jgi:hypothetical protein
MEERKKTGWNFSFAESRIPHSVAAPHVFKTQVQAREDKPLTKYPSYVYEYGRSCCLSAWLSIVESTAAGMSPLCAVFVGRICTNVCF